MILSCLEIRHTAHKGWGVFTTKSLLQNTIIEISPVIVMSEKERKLLDKTTLYNYIFEWEKNQCCMAMGYVSIYNHSCPSNCEYYQDYDAKTITIKTVKNISKNEELSINYQGDFDNKKPVWFEVK